MEHRAMRVVEKLHTAELNSPFSLRLGQHPCPTRPDTTKGDSQPLYLILRSKRDMATSPRRVSENRNG